MTSQHPSITDSVHLGLDVEDLDETVGFVTLLREAGWDTMGEIVDHESTLLLCCVRGAEGLIVELAERLGD